MNNQQTNFLLNKEDKKIIVQREFASTIENVWAAWTEDKLLDQWWAPKPFKAKTKLIDFKVGGYWLFAMEGPDNSKQWVRSNFIHIDFQKSFQTESFFSDENGNKNPQFPGMVWKNEFYPSETGTKVIVEISCASELDIEKIIAMGFESGFVSALNNLEEILNTGKL